MPFSTTNKSSRFALACPINKLDQGFSFHVQQRSQLVGVDEFHCVSIRFLSRTSWTFLELQFVFVYSFFFNIDRSSCGIGNLRTTDDNICALEQIESFLFSANLEINYRLNWFFYRYSMILNSFICRIWCENNNEINDSFPMSMNALNSSCCCACYVDYVRYCWWSCQDNRFAVHVCRF